MLHRTHKTTFPMQEIILFIFNFIHLLPKRHFLLRYVKFPFFRNISVPKHCLKPSPHGVTDFKLEHNSHCRFCRFPHPMGVIPDANVKKQARQRGLIARFTRSRHPRRVVLPACRHRPKLPLTEFPRQELLCFQTPPSPVRYRPTRALWR